MASSLYLHLTPRRRNVSAGNKSSARMRMVIPKRGRSVSRRAKSVNRSRRGRRRTRKSGHRKGRRGTTTKKGGYKRGRSVGKNKKTGRRKRRNSKPRSRGGILFRANRGIYDKSYKQQSRTPRQDNSSNCSLNANLSDNFNSEGEDTKENPVTSVWRTYTCVIS